MAEIVDIFGSIDWRENYIKLKKYHDDAYSNIDEGLSCENNGETDSAIRKYDDGLLLIDKALAVPIDCPSNPDPTWQKACKMFEQMKRTRKEILSRLSDIQALRNAARASSTSSSSGGDAPPSYDEAVASGCSVPSTSSTNNLSNMNNNVSANIPANNIDQSNTSKNVPNTVHNTIPNVTASTSNPSNVTDGPSTSKSNPKRSELSLVHLGKALESARYEIERQKSLEIFTCNNVVVCHVSIKGEVSTSSQSDCLKIFLTEDVTNPHYYLQLGSWRYPLIRGVSPCIRTRYGAFLFPDVEFNIEGRSIGVIVPDDCIEPLAAILEDILNVEFEDGGHPGTKPPSDLPEAISQRILSGGNYISNALIKGAEKVEQCLNYGTPRVIEKISPNQEPTEMPSKLKKSIKVTKNVTESAAKTTGYIADKVSYATVSLGKFLSPHVYKGGTALITKYYGCKEEEATKTVDNVMTVAAGAVQSIGVIYGGLEVAGAILGKSISDNTVQIVNHKYGQPAGEFTQDTFHTVGNCLEINTNVRSLATKKLLKNTVKQTGKQVLEHGKKSPEASRKQNEKQNEALNEKKK